MSRRTTLNCRRQQHELTMWYKQWEVLRVHMSITVFNFKKCDYHDSWKMWSRPEACLLFVGEWGLFIAKSTLAIIKHVFKEGIKENGRFITENGDLTQSDSRRKGIGRIWMRIVSVGRTQGLLLCVVSHGLHEKRDLRGLSLGS